MKRIRQDNINTEDYFNSRFVDKSDYYEDPWSNLRVYDEDFDLGIFSDGSILGKT